MAETATMSGNRPQTLLSFPTLHLDSFRSLSPQRLPSPESPTRTHPQQWEDLEAGPSARPDGPSRQASDQTTSASGSSSTARCDPVNKAVISSRSSLRSRTSLPPPLPMPTMALPPLPALPPVSPRHIPSPMGTATNLMPARLSTDRPRPLGPSLTIHIPGPLTPTSEKSYQSSPVLKNSPGIARRRTVVEASPAASRASPGRITDVGNFSPPCDGSPKRRQPSPASLKQGSLVMPIALPLPAKASTQPELQKKASSNNLNRSSISPSTKRSLPRPPGGDRVSSGNPSIQDLRAAALPAGAGPSLASSLSGPLHAPTGASTWPPPGAPKGSFNVLANFPPPPPPPHHITAKHQNTASASSLPVIPGLSDAGPYGAASPAATAMRSNQATNGVGLGRPPVKGTQRPLQQQEEVCLECMMRDRDLADVIVQGKGVWERSSDVDWEDLKWRERTLVDSMGAGSMMSVHLPSLDHSDGFESESAGTSPQSTALSVESNDARRHMVAKTQRESGRIFKRQTDERVAKELGWRGFSWEEAGEGLPKGFRGSRGGNLTEDGIKAVMTRYPHASQHRFNTLQIYLREQWQLVQEIHAEAKRIGRYPPPGETSVASSLSSHDSEVFTGPRTSSISWDSRHTRELSEQMRGAFASPRSTPGLSLVRPSPSSPADLSTGTPRAKVPPVHRPLTSFYPDREPVAQRNPPMSLRAKGRHEIGYNPPSVIERSPRFDEWVEPDEELYPPISPVDSGLRPFSFAVRAGAHAARDGSEGHGRKKMWGRWGGSVTSFFGGSHGGSGSMVDMHLGLENDPHDPHPRAMSMASPARNSFFSRSPRPASVNHDREVSNRNPSRMPKSISTSRLSQMVSDPDEEPEKKKGLKGFLKGLKKKERKVKSPTTSSPREDTSDLNTPLAPPPSIPYLVKRGDRQNRDRSGSVSSMLTDSQVSYNNNRNSGQIPNGMRSVSAPNGNGNGASSSGGSQSASPTSSKFATGPRRESYASHTRDRRRSAAEEMDHRGSVLEVLASSNGKQIHTSPDQTLQSLDESSHPTRGTTYPPPTQYRQPHNKTTSTFSNSSFIETPPPTLHQITYFNHQAKSNVTSQPDPISPNRFKNLPPLPPNDSTEGLNAQPDFSTASTKSRGFNSTSASPYNPYSPYNPNSPYNSNSPYNTDGSKQMSQMEYHRPPRVSLDPPKRRGTDERGIGGGGGGTTRLAQSMYVQPSGNGSVGSFGGYHGYGGGYGSEKERGREGEGMRKGKKGIFGMFGKGKVA